jgi:photolyase PhrII
MRSEIALLRDRSPLQVAFVNMTLPPSLQERCHWLAPPEDDPSRGAFVLYWMHNALRAEENPALDVALAAARARDLPLLVYQGLGEIYPYASDRHHAFILQGARDVQRQFADRGIRYAFQLQRPGQRGSYLKQLGQQADLIVTEEIPVEPLSGWLDRLRQRTGRPLVVVDTSCIIPMRSVLGDFHDVASFRTATSEEFSHRVPRRWEAQPFDVAAYTSDLPFVPLDLQNECLARLIAECEIDHTVGPVADTPGGSRAGYRRWQTFLAEGLSHYAERRHDAACLGTSRMSAYLHYGMVSPFRLAREAAASGAEAFLDALLVWRELAFHFCLRHGDELDTMEGLPRWAQQTLEKHRDDPRPFDCAWEDLARGKTGDPLWDNCQRSLLRHGELHGDLRSVWGTALLEWVQSPSRALQMAIDLNHRYALDGRGPCSYSGILSCFGQFERPRPTEQPVFGTVRSRPLREHAARIDDARFAERATRPIAQPLPRIAICRGWCPGADLAILCVYLTMTIPE